MKGAREGVGVGWGDGLGIGVTSAEKGERLLSYEDGGIILGEKNLARVQRYCIVE